MEWWQKLRRAWAFISASLRARKIANGKCTKNSNGGFEASSNGGIEKGLLSLRDDVETCEYQDVHVLWDILNRLQVEQATQAASSSKSKKKGHPWRAFFCSFSLLH